MYVANAYPSWIVFEVGWFYGRSIGHEQQQRHTVRKSKCFVIKKHGGSTTDGSAEMEAQRNKSIMRVVTGVKYALVILLG